MRRTALALMGMGLAAVVLAVFAVSYSNESAINAEDILLESAAEDKLQEVLTQKVYIESDDHYESFSQAPNSDFSRRRQTAVAKTEVGDRFDAMFDEYFEDPAGTDLAKGLDVPAPKPEATKTKQVVEVIDVLKPINNENAPKPNAENPPEVATFDGKDFEIGKVIKVQKDVVVTEPAAPTTKPAPTSDGTLILKGTPGAATGASVAPAADKKQVQDEKVDTTTEKDTNMDTTTKETNIAKPTATQEAAKPTAAQEKPPVEEVKPLVVKTTITHAAVPKTVTPVPKTTATPAAVPKIIAKPVTRAVIKGSTNTYSPFGQGSKKVGTDSIHMPVPTVGKNHQELGMHLILPPLVDPASEPKVLKEPEVRLAPMEIGAKSHTKPNPTEAATPQAVPTTAKSLPEDGVFGDVKGLKGGVWTNGNSDWSTPSPWTSASKAPWNGGSQTEITAMIEEPSTDNNDTPPWAQFGAKVDAPWEEQPTNPKKTGADLIQMAARSCAARKVQQKKACNKMTAAAKSESERKSAQVLCASSAKATFNACFTDWQIAKKGTGPH